MYKKILIRFGEISLKGKNKMNFINKLAFNISKICDINLKDIEIMIDRIFIPYKEKYIEKLNYVFGISSFSPVIEITSNLKEIEDEILKINLEEHQTFKINARRKWKEFEKNSMELNNYFGAIVLKKKNLRVKVNNPDIEINIEIHKNYSYLFWQKIKGLGGLPVGSSGKSLHLLSGGIDSPVAAIEMIKRGIKLIFLSFISPPHTDENTLKKIIEIVKEITKYQIDSKLYLFNYTDIMNYIGLVSKQQYKIILMRRSFYRIASIIANNLNCLAISNGENIGQVASQTMEAIKVIHNASTLPIYQPLLTNDKLETIKLSQKYKLFDISIIKACETCELFAPTNPTTKPKLEFVEILEKELDLLNTYENEGINKKIEKMIFKLEKSN